MNNSNTLRLSFHDVSFKAVRRETITWLQAGEIGKALGYANSEIAINKIYGRHADEFTPAMTKVLKVMTAGGKQSVRFFSLRGAHLIAMFARTAVAKKFRAWVLDLIDREIERDAARKTVDAATMEELAALCNETDVVCAWWRKFGSAVETLNPKLHAAVREHFLFAQARARTVQRDLSLKSSKAYMDGYPWLGNYTDREHYRKSFGPAMQSVGGAC